MPQHTNLNMEAVRSAFPILDTINYLNTGTYGPMPEPALQALLDATAALEREGVACGRPFGQDADQVRSILAEMIGARPEDIAFSRNATDGVNLVLAGLTWNEGDEIITTDQEHEAVLHPLLYLQSRTGIRVRRIACSPDPGEMLRRLDAHVSERTRLVAFSHVTCETGTRLPAGAICAWVAERGILSLLDSAQSLGAVPVDVGAIGCDFLAGNGHKWLHGPKGTGLLYARTGLMERLVPAHVGAGSLERADVDTGEARPWATGARFEFGTRSWALASGWKESLRWLTNLGLVNVNQHISSLAGYACESIGSIGCTTVLTPAEAPARAGLVSFTCRGYDAAVVGRRLREEASVVSRHVPRQNAVRVSAAHFTAATDVDRLCETLARMMRDG